ncbi:hypothetical protein HQO44_20885 [Rhodococcus fascians]|uniref:Cap15 family cyclic dinucleotide receptor domain-containing protein n=1 Tax=Rhodococcoides fascians TaxID=1828 RepID=UPI00050CDC6D|nr:hypothetical protein [Rhodococcus fascians]AMY54935.1 hypothetical protein A3L23_03615 [Rhodococcus fascians D188]MBY4208910.1 hypothetical protein [Rhodococcus fascians]
MSKDQARLVRIVAVAVSAVWGAGLYLSGVDIDDSMRRLLAYIPSASVLLAVAFDLWIWKWPGVHILVGRPRMDGTWRTTIRPHQKSQIPKGGNWGPITSAVVVEQTFWTISVRLLTAESSSMSEIASLRNHGESKEQTLLTYTYRNEPRAEHRPRSAPHRGACEFTVVGRLPKYITGTYWTDRFTVGDMDLTYVDRKKDRQSLADLPLS